MSWSSLTNRKAVSGNNLISSGIAVNSGQTIPANNRCIKCNEIDTLCAVQAVSGGNKLVLKEQIIPLGVTTYGCGNGAQSLINVTSGFPDDGHYEVNFNMGTTSGTIFYDWFVADASVTSSSSFVWDYEVRVIYAGSTLQTTTTYSGQSGTNSFYWTYNGSDSIITIHYHNLNA